MPNRRDPWDMFRLPLKVGAAAAALGSGLVDAITTATVRGSQVDFQNSQGVTFSNGTFTGGVTRVGAPVDGDLYYYEHWDDLVGDDPSSVSQAAPQTATIVTALGEEYTLAVGAQEEIDWQRANGSAVLAGDTIATGNDMRITMHVPPGSQVETSTLRNVIGQENQGFFLNAGSHPDDLPREQTDVRINSANILGVTIGDDTRLQVDPNVVSSGSQLQVFAPGNFQPVNSSIVSEIDPVVYIPEPGTVSVRGSDGHPHIISPYTSGVEVDRVVSSQIGYSYTTVLEGDEGDFSITSSNSNQLYSYQTETNRTAEFAELRPLGGQITVPSGTGYAVVDTQDEQGVLITPDLDGGNTMIGYSTGSADNSEVDVAVGSELVLVANSDMANFVNGGPYVSYPVRDGQVHLTDPLTGPSVRGLDDQGIANDFFPVMYHPTGGAFGLAGAPFLERVQVAENSIANATRTAPTYTTRTTTTARVPETTPGTTPRANPGSRGEQQEEGLSGGAIAGIAFAMFAAAAMIGLAAYNRGRRSERAAAQNQGRGGDYENPLYAEADFGNDNTPLRSGLAVGVAGLYEYDLNDLELGDDRFSLGGSSTESGITPAPGDDFDADGYLVVNPDTDDELYVEDDAAAYPDRAPASRATQAQGQRLTSQGRYMGVR